MARLRAPGFSANNYAKAGIPRHTVLLPKTRALLYNFRSGDGAYDYRDAAEKLRVAASYWLDATLMLHLITDSECSPLRHRAAKPVLSRDEPA